MAWVFDPEEKILRRRYFEIDVDNDTEKKFRIFVEERQVEERFHDLFWHYAWHYGGYNYGYYEISSGEKVEPYLSCWGDSIYIPYVAVNSDLTDNELAEWGAIDSNRLKRIKDDTEKGVPIWRMFLSFQWDKMYKTEVSPNEISDYLRELEADGKENEYADYVRNLVLDLQRKYVEALTPFCEQYNEGQEQGEKSNQAEAHINSFSKRLKKSIY